MHEVPKINQTILKTYERNMHYDTKENKNQNHNIQSFIKRFNLQRHNECYEKECDHQMYSIIKPSEYNPK